MEEFVEIIRGLLSGKPFSFDGKYFSFKDFPKLVPEELKVPILFGTSSPKMLRLSGMVADGVVLNSIGTSDYFKYALSQIKEGASEVGRKVEDLEIGASIVVAVADKHENAVDVARPDILFYLLYPELDPVISKTSYFNRIEEIRQANSIGDTKRALSLVTDEMVEDLAVVGTATECRTKMKQLADYGITLPIVRVSIQPIAESERKAAFLRTIEALANL
jgi:5,10-methylenetetrahydromethanopterin reductase